MKRILFLLALFPFFLFPYSLNAGDKKQDSWNKSNTLLKPYKHNAYGPGKHSDATGRPFNWRTRDGKKIDPFNQVKPDAYGPGIGMDKYGRPVKPVPEW